MERLSARERELAEALHRGMSRTDICTSMGITRSTLQNYLKSIYLKLGIGSEAQLVLIVERDKAAPRA